MHIHLQYIFVRIQIPLGPGPSGWELLLTPVHFFFKNVKSALQRSFQLIINIIGGYLIFPVTFQLIWLLICVCGGILFLFLEES